MENDIGLNRLAGESIQLEYNVSRLYMIFRDAHPEDSDFWWQLVIEESNHAALIKSGRDYFLPENLWLADIFPALEEMQKVNRQLDIWMKQYTIDPPSREDAFNLALKVELSAGEIHFQRVMTLPADSQVLEMFQKLNQDDKDHAKRIQAYMKENQIPVQKSNDQ